MSLAGERNHGRDKWPFYLVDNTCPIKKLRVLKKDKNVIKQKNDFIVADVIR